ncbi:YafY family transcriptional regulator [Paenibacillus antri]|uniref:YafY family transcriptional regulator n=1 Tax=Paenibacillus antri TaxID=2582848 RepID=A0A5R9G6S3_9BACL|nr:YafY family protein [Paenibacillus antri]TLS48674.1 YafY family transcriptional regulator [Paenibacillus antri]
MHKAQRLIQLMMLVNEKRRFTIRELADELGVSRRTIIRDLGELGELGVPLYSEVGAAGGYRVLHDKMLPPIHFTEHEAVAIFFASQALERYSALPFELETSSALRKFYAKLPGDVRAKIDRLKRRLTFWVPPRRVAAPHLRTLLDAALEGAEADIEYDGSSGRLPRRIRPTGVYAMNGLWYVQAYCYRREADRLFRADRVLSASIVPDGAGAGGEPEGPFLPWTPPAADDPAALPLEVELTREGARRAAADPWLAEGLETRPDGTGAVRTTMPASYVPWATAFFLGFGADARVERPPELRRAISHIADEVRRMYV